MTSNFNKDKNIFLLVIIDEKRYEQLLQCEEKLKKITSKSAQNKEGYGSGSPQENEKKHLELQNKHALETPIPTLIESDDIRKKELKFVTKKNMKLATELLKLLIAERSMDWSSNGELSIDGVDVKG